MAQVPQDKSARKTNSFNNSLSLKNSFLFEDTISVKDSAVFQIEKMKYLVKRQFGKTRENDLLNWLDDLTKQGWELVSQSVTLGFYIFKKPAR